LVNHITGPLKLILSSDDSNGKDNVKKKREEKTIALITKQTTLQAYHKLFEHFSFVTA